MRTLISTDTLEVRRFLAQPINKAALNGGGVNNNMERILLKTATGTHALAFGFESCGKLIAAGSLNNINYINSAADVGTMLLDEDLPTRKRWAAAREFGAQLVRHAFNDLNLRRLSARAIVGFPLLGHGRSVYSGMVREGLLREAIYQDGRYHDVEVWGLLKKDWQKEEEHHAGQSAGVDKDSRQPPTDERPLP